MDVNECDSLRSEKPGWMVRVLGIETARLVACDARRTDEGWTRPSAFEFLYWTRSGVFHLLHDPHESRALPVHEARAIYERLPIQLMRGEELFERSAPE